jgi:hypothetical protein
MIAVEFPDEESLRVAIEAVAAKYVSDNTPISRAEYAMDSALKAYEEREPTELATPRMRCVDCGASAYVKDEELVCINAGDASHQKALSELFGPEPLIRFTEET